MYYGEIKNCDIANGEGVRVTLFVSGCTNRCKNCFQPQTWAFDYGQPFTAETEEALLQMLAPAYISWTGALWRSCTTSRSASAARATSASSTCRARCRAAASHSGRINKPWLKSRSRS